MKGVKTIMERKGLGGGGQWRCEAVQCSEGKCCWCEGDGAVRH